MIDEPAPPANPSGAAAKGKERKGKERNGEELPEGLLGRRKQGSRDRKKDQKSDHVALEQRDCVSWFVFCVWLIG
jgi:hypothetical protein